MTGYTPLIPTHYQFPYKHMLRDFTEQVKLFSAHRKMNPNYIIINPEDRESLIHEMTELKMLPRGKPSGKLQHMGVRIIESPDIIKGFFEVTGN